MFACVLGLAATGILMSNGLEAVEEVHEVLAWTMAGAVGVHLTGIALHTLREREPIARSMVNGRRMGEARTPSPRRSPWRGSSSWR